MTAVDGKFATLGVDHAPGQEVRTRSRDVPLRGDALPGRPVDFSHGDVDAFTPTPGALDEFLAGYRRGGPQAYTEYRGGAGSRADVAAKLAAFTGVPVDADDGLIITPGTQGALFLAVGATVGRLDKVAIVEPDYFANRKLVDFFDGVRIPVRLDHLGASGRAGLDLDQLEAAFAAGARVFLFSNPNNPAGAIYAADEIRAIAALAGRYGVTVIVDELYSRLPYEGRSYVHLRAMDVDPERIVTILGPSKTESLSGFRLGVAFGSKAVVEHMEKLQAIVSLRAAGYCQAVLKTWFAEPPGWMDERIRLHKAIRDDLLRILRGVDGVAARTTEAGSYLFPRLPRLAVSLPKFVTILRLQAGVTVTPGTEFGPFADSVRLNFSQDHAAAVQAVERIATLIDRYRV
jgi:aspartate/methionine/tyrosine aminotransferase